MDTSHLRQLRSATSGKSPVSLATVQNRWNLLQRSIEDKVVPACRELGLGILPWAPLASGLLTGKVQRGATPPHDSRLSEPTYQHWLSERNLTLVDDLASRAKSIGRTLLEVSLAWLAQHSDVASVIAGAMTPHQVRQNITAAHVQLAPDEFGLIDDLTAAP